jgi:beta-N-acetylglucosaminidase
MKTGKKFLTNGRRVKKSKRMAVLLAFSLLSGQICHQGVFSEKIFHGTGISHAAAVSTTGTVAVKSVKIKKKAGGTANLKDADKNVIILKKGKNVTIKKKLTAAGKKWYKIKFSYKKNSYQGYILRSKLTLNASSETTRTGTVTADFLNVRTGAGVSYGILQYQGDDVGLEEGTEVTILSEDDSPGKVWYQISFSYEGKELKGYVSSSYIKTKETTATTTNTGKNEETTTTTTTNTGKNEETATTTTNTGKNEETTTTTNTGKNEETTTTTTNTGKNEETTTTTTNTGKNEETATTTTNTVLSEEEFEAAMTEQGFPESYKPYLRQLHKQHPSWSFEAYQTGLKWTTVIKKQSKVGRNLIPNSKGVGWKSLEEGAYDWTTDSFVPYDGTTWVTASKKAVKYYMDPRNFLTETGIYQFELLSYNSTCQTKDGVTAILKNTPMAENKSYSYTDPDTSKTAQITYVQTFLKAAELSGVSPYHLASRVRQEVVVSSTSFSNSATGTYSGYEGYYNFYNIGANDSAGGGAIAKGLTYAKKTDSTYLLPWTSPYRSIVGGAIYIGKSYINKGQNTLYLEKFNVTPTLTYNHQYMSNVEGASSEAQKIYTAYSEMDELPLVFSIPVYLNMPETVSAKPKKGKNPNNWLKTLSIDGYSLTPTFHVSDAAGTVYSLIVDSSVDSVKINASCVSSSASLDGTGKKKLETGENSFTVKVTAENGDVREYEIKVLKNK